MTGLLRPVIALLIAAAVLLMGNGIMGVLLPIRADLEGFTRLEIGIMGSVYYTGLMAGCFLAPPIIARFGYIRAFVAFTATATVTPLLHAIWSDPIVWSLLRGINGLCFAGLFMGIESWLSATAAPGTRGRVLAVYTVINLTVVTAGMQMLQFSQPMGFQLFSLVAMLYSLSAVPVALAPTAAPSLRKTIKLRLGWLISVSPAAVLGCFFTGIANSGFWSLSPLYAKGAGLSVGEVATFVSTIVLAGAASQWPIGYLSDRLGRRGLLTFVALTACFAGIGLFLFSTGDMRLIFALGALYGAMAFPVYTLSVAHANDLVHKKRAVEVSSGLLLMFSIGAMIGPVFASLLMSNFGHGALFLHSALAHILIASVMLVRVQLRPKPPNKRHEEFVVVPRTTPAVFELDPRGEPRPANAARVAAQPSPQSAPGPLAVEASAARTLN